MAKKNTSHAKGSRGGAPVRVIMGKQCVEEALKACPQRFEEVVALDSLVRQGDTQEFSRLCKQHHISVQGTSPSQLHALTHSDSHQGIVGLLKPIPHRDLKEAFKVEEGLFLFLDAIEDPHNLGAILRAAECFQVTGVVWSKNRGSGYTPVVSKSSVGASELVACYEVSNLVEALRKAKKEGYWIVVAEGGSESTSIGDFEFPKQSALVLGSEGGGVSRLAREQADYVVGISMFGQISSLNVSQAASILLHEWRRTASRV